MIQLKLKESNFYPIAHGFLMDQLMLKANFMMKS